MPFLPLLLFVAGAVQDPAASEAPVEDWARPTQPNGPGLWIGGVAFAPQDVAAAEQAFDPGTGYPIIVLTFSPTGQPKFAALQQDRVGDVLEVALDGELIFSPFLVEPIEGAQVAISGNFTLEEAERLALRLRNLARGENAPIVRE